MNGGIVGLGLGLEVKGDVEVGVGVVDEMGEIGAVEEDVEGWWA